MTKSLRIALLGPANTVHLQRWAHGLASRGHELCVYSQHPCESHLLPQSARTVWLPRAGQLGYFSNARFLRRELREWKPNILNAHYASGYGTTAALVGWHPTVLSVWGSDVYDFPSVSPLHKWLVRRNLKSADVVASTSIAMAAQVSTLLPALSDIQITPFGVDMGRFTPREGPPESAVLTIGIVKTLAPKYGIDILIRAFAQVVTHAEIVAREVRCRLLIVGKGPQLESLQKLAISLGVEGLVEFPGAVPHTDVPDWLRRMDIFVAPSRLDSESFGVAVIEAAACELPVIVSNVGGLPEVVDDGITGLIVPKEDVPSLAAAIRRLVIDPNLRQSLGRHGRERVIRDYEWSRCVDAMQQCYSLALGR